MPAPRTLSELERAVQAHLAELDRLEARAVIVDPATLTVAAERATARIVALVDRHTVDGNLDLAALTTTTEQARAVAAEMIRQAMAPPDAFLSAVRDASLLGIEFANTLGGPIITRLEWGPRSAPARQLAAALYARESPLRRLVAAIPGGVADTISARLTTALLTGQNPRVAAREMIAAGAELTRARANTIARTEILRAQRDATRTRYEQAPGVDEWVWLSAADSRTCAVCWAMHGTRHPVDDTLDGHPNCRCTMVPVVTGGSADKIRSGDELLAEVSEEQARKILGPKRHELWVAGELDLSDMVGQRDNAEWGTMRTLTPLGA